MNRLSIFLVLLSCMLGTRSVGAQQTVQPSRDVSKEIQSIQEAITHRGARWEAAVNDIFLLPWPSRQQMCGALDSTSADGVPENMQTFRYAWHPAKFDWRNKDGQNWMTAVRDQGGCGSCVAFGTLSALEGQLNIYHNDPAFDLDLSEQHLFNCGGGTCDEGWYTDAAYQYIQNTGVPDEDCFPYTSGSTGVDEPCGNSCPGWRERVTKITCYGAVGNNTEPKTPAEIKDQLLKGPMTTVMTVFEDFFAYSGGVYEHVTGEVAGGHAVCFVGWDDTTEPPCWIVRNSWGLWGESGYFRIKMGSNECGIESNILFLALGQVPKGRSSDNGHLFGKVAIGASEGWSFSLLNEGEANLEIYGFSSELPDFSITSPTSFPQAIVPGGSLDVTAAFAPESLGFRYDRINIQSNSCKPLQDLKMRGEGIIHSVQATPKTIAETLPQGAMKKAPAVTVSYSGDTTLTYTVTVLRDWLSVQPTSGKIGAGGKVFLDISLDGSALPVGQYNTNILFKTDDPYDKVVVIPVRVTVEYSAIVLALPPAIRTVEDACDIPILMDNTTGIRKPLAAVSLQLEYDDQLLQLQSVRATARTEHMGNLQWVIDHPGLVTLSISDNNGHSIDINTGSIIDVSFSLGNGAMCEQTTELRLQDVTVLDTTSQALDVNLQGGPLLLLCRGDCNSDGLVNVLDVVATVNHILEIKSLAEDVQYRADCSGDGRIDVLDALGMVNVILGTGQCEQ